MSRVTVEGRVDRDMLLVTWSDAKSAGSGRFDRLPNVHPEWLGDADELLDGANRRQEPAILAAVAEWGADEGFELGLWADGQGVEILTDSRQS